MSIKLFAATTLTAPAQVKSVLCDSGYVGLSFAQGVRDTLLIRPDEVSSGIANTPILKVGDNAFWRALEQSHMLVGSIA